MCTRILALVLLLFPFSLFSQTLPADMPPGTIIFEGEMLDQETVWSTEFMDIPSLYTINWFSLETVYDGQLEETLKIPVVTLGGQLDGKFVIATHSITFEKHYKYIVALEPCTNCVEGFTVYIPLRLVAEFQKEKFTEQRNLLKDRIRLGGERECKFEEPPTLYLSFGNINLDVNGTTIDGSIKVSAKTNEVEKMLVKLDADVDYNTNVFGENAVTNQVIQMNFASEQGPLENDYSFQSFNLASNSAKFSLQRNFPIIENNFIIINTVFQPTMELSFSLPLSSLNNLPNALENILEIVTADASFYCEGREVSFADIVIIDHPIGVSFEGGSDETITYSFGNASYDPDDNTYIIKIFASSSAPTRLRSGTIRIDYNPLAFVPFQTPVSLVLPFYLPSPQITSTGESSFEITFTDNDTDIEDFQLIDGTTELYTISFDVADCTQSADLSFDEEAMQGLSTYVEEENINLPIAYQQVFANDVHNRVVCCSTVPDIQTWDPTLLIAGDQMIFTVTGSGFGEYNRGVNPGENGEGSSVLFHNGGYFEDSSRPEYVAAAEHDFMVNDIIEWTDNKIQLRVASTDYLGNGNNSPGSGFFKVRNECNVTTTSSEELIIPFSLDNQRTSAEGRAYRVGLRDSAPGSDDNGYFFEFDPSIENPSSTTDIQVLFIEALDRWCEKTQINFTRAENINTSSVPDAPTHDGRNTFSVANIFGDDGTGAFTSVGLLIGQFQCGLNSSSLNAGYIVTEIDIVADDNIWDAQPATIRESFMHELGHAQMLNHAWCGGNPGDCLMFPQGSFSNGGPTEDDTEGANRVNTTSNSIINESGTCLLGGTGDGINGIMPITDTNCGDTSNDVDEIDLSAIKLYPNPSNGLFNIDGVSEFSGFTLRNGFGQIIQEGMITDNLISLNLMSYPSGAYVLMLTNGTQIGYIKLMKI